ncbi:inner nuclear membrane protein enriched at telomere/subtelomere region [Vermiconidia calcicola]|uniref:Inner nuclear membrane protein enriched at telomere/subtelomere region n=1 Tax=Vermiconidia calcicola TaxID=1690605 RepID=A0ACC3MMS3_9PEZI|nr:inner nuclear membrane protein enriched at telomere/subtelomere region [Vermiconidia calcicola]
MDNEAYLEPGFDPSTFTVPQLRSVLVAHSVNYPSSAKKNQLIELFNDNVLSQARKLRTANARVKRTSRGIENIPASQSTDNDDEEEEEQPPPRPSSSRRSTGRSTRARTEEAQEVAPATRSSRHSTAPHESTPRRVSSKHARTIDRAEADPAPEPKRPASRRSRQSAQTPVVRQEAADDGSPFSHDNVFQSGSSPLAQTDRKRSTMSVTKDADRRRSRDARRRTEEVKPARQQMDGAVVPTRKTFEVPVTSKKRDEVEPSEEFTPEEQQEMALTQQSGQAVAVRPKSTKPAAKAAKNGIGAMFVALTAAFAYLWSEEKFNVGYCGHGEPSTDVAGVEIPEWASVLRPACEPCPPHAICYDRLETACEAGFVLTQSPLSMGAKLPIPPACEPDTARTRKVNAVRERVVEELRDQNAKYECGESSSPKVKEKELKKDISKQRRKGMSNEEFEDLWDSAIGEVRSADEVSEGTDKSGEFTLRSSSLRNISLACSVKRSLRETLREYLWYLVGILLVAASGTYGQYMITSGRETETMAKQIAGQVYQTLSYQAALHASDPDAYRENYVPVAQLRDDVLRNEYSTFRRKKIWEKVQQKVEHNSNVRPMVREGRSGDVGRVWEWVGAIGMLESPPASHERRKSGRVSFGGEQWVSPRSEDSTEMSQVSRWKENQQ